VVGADITDALGNFTVNNVPEGSYELEVVDVPGALHFRWAVSIAGPQAPARICGRVLMDDDGVRVSANIKAAVLEGGCLLNGVALAPRIWSPDWQPAHESVKVVMAGINLTAVTAVSLQTGEGEVTSTTFRFNDHGGMVAVFPGAETYQALVPAGAAAGDLLEVTVTVSTGDSALTYRRTVVIGPIGDWGHR
jgi:hypothetical protein